MRKGRVKWWGRYTWWKEGGSRRRGRMSQSPVRCCSAEKLVTAISLKSLSPLFRASASLLIRSVRVVWVMLWPANSMSLLYLLQADLRLIFPSARWILAQLLSISICAKVKSLQDLGLNAGCLATAPFDPLNPTLFQPGWTASCGDVDEGEAGGDEGGVGASGPAR